MLILQKIRRNLDEVAKTEDSQEKYNSAYFLLCIQSNLLHSSIFRNLTEFLLFNICIKKGSSPSTSLSIIYCLRMIHRLLSSNNFLSASESLKINYKKKDI